MPIKADLANEDAISYSGSLLNINQGLAQNISMTDLAAAAAAAGANLNGATTTSSGGSGNGGTGGKQSLKSEKISRFDGGEQQIIVSIIHIKINF
jgi:hypothetical protein